MASMFGLPESLATPDPDAEFDPILDVLAKIAKKYGKLIFQLSCVCVLDGSVMVALYVEKFCQYQNATQGHFGNCVT